MVKLFRTFIRNINKFLKYIKFSARVVNDIFVINRIEASFNLLFAKKNLYIYLYLNLFK